MKSGLYKYYLLAILLSILAFSYVDRLALSLVVQDVKSDLHLTDTQLGVITGFAFSLFYALMGIPIGRWADRGNRRVIISVTIGLWSCVAAVTGLARNFLQLALVRVGVGVGEAGCVPPAHSLIADYFPRAERPRAMGIYMLASPLSMLVGWLLAGWLKEMVGWRMMFAILAIPGIVLAILAAFTVKEPRERPPADAGGAAGPTADAPPGTIATLKLLWSLRTYRRVVIALSLLTFLSSGLTQWLPTFFIRSHGLSTSQVGLWFTVVFGIGGVVGLYGGGALASRFAPNDERLHLKVFAIFCLVLAAVRPLSFLLPSTVFAFAVMVAAALLTYLAEGPTFAILQTLVPERLRGVAVAVLYMSMNLLGAGLGPMAVGALSDAFASWAGADSLRYAMAAICMVYPLAVWPIWLASRSVAEDVARLGLTTGGASPGPDPAPLTVDPLTGESVLVPAPSGR